MPRLQKGRTDREVVKFDAALVAEIPELLKQEAIEKGQWIEKSSGTAAFMNLNINPATGLILRSWNPVHRRYPGTRHFSKGPWIGGKPFDTGVNRGTAPGDFPKGGGPTKVFDPEPAARLRCQGHSYRQIAKSLGLGVGTMVRTLQGRSKSA